MDYLVMAWKAFDLRQFLEAENYLIKLESEAHEKSSELYKLKYQIYTALESHKKIESLKSYLEFLNKEKNYQATIQVCVDEFKNNSIHQSFLYKYYCESLYQTGNHSSAAKMAREHVEFLITKKIYHELKLALDTYQQYFKNYLFFKIMSLQVSIIFENLTEAEKKWIEISEIVERKFNKMEDTKDVERKDILHRCHELIVQIQAQSINSVLLSHKSHLKLKEIEDEKLLGSDWKKLVELIVYERSFYNLKLTMNLSLGIDEEIFKEANRLIKRKKGYSLIKLTRFDKKLKEKLISKKEKTLKDDVYALSEKDLELEKVTKQEIQKIEVQFEKDEDSIQIEKSLIRSLAFLDFGETSIIDLITTFVQLEYYQVANFLIKTALNEMRLDEALKRKITYLKATVSMKTGEYYLALAELSDLLGNKSIDLTEYTELRYMEGVLFEFVGNKKNALQSFREVIAVDPNYRRVKERMQTIA